MDVDLENLPRNIEGALELQLIELLGLDLEATEGEIRDAAQAATAIASGAAYVRQSAKIVDPNPWQVRRLVRSVPFGILARYPNRIEAEAYADGYNDGRSEPAEA